MEIYERIKELRKKMGLSQDELAKRAGYTSRTSIAKIEAGKVDLPQSKIRAFAIALGTTESYLMGWDDPGPTLPDIFRLTTDPEIVAHAESMLRDYEEIGPEAVEKTVEIMEKLNATGKMKVYEYARDLEDSGNYK